MDRHRTLPLTAGTHHAGSRAHFHEQFLRLHSRNGCRRPPAQLLFADHHRCALAGTQAGKQFAECILRSHAPADSTTSAATSSTDGSLGSIPEATSISRSFISNSSYLREQELG